MGQFHIAGVSAGWESNIGITFSITRTYHPDGGFLHYDGSLS